MNIYEYFYNEILFILHAAVISRDIQICSYGLDEKNLEGDNTSLIPIALLLIPSIYNKLNTRRDQLRSNLQGTNKFKPNFAQ